MVMDDCRAFAGDGAISTLWDALYTRVDDILHRSLPVAGSGLGAAARAGEARLRGADQRRFTRLPRHADALHLVSRPK
jgi:hypothetical protein